MRRGDRCSVSNALRAVLIRAVRGVVSSIDAEHRLFHAGRVDEAIAGEVFDESFVGSAGRPPGHAHAPPSGG